MVPRMRNFIKGRYRAKVTAKGQSKKKGEKKGSAALKIAVMAKGMSR